MDATQFVQNFNLLEGLPVLDNLQPNANPAQNLPNVGVSPEFVNAAMTQPVEINQALTPPAEKTSPADDWYQQFNNADVQNFRSNYPKISPREFSMQNQIYEQKLKYDTAQKALAKTTDAEEKTTYRKIMEDAATNAKILRENAQRLGLDTTGFGAEDTFSDAVQRMNYNRNRGMFDLLDTPSTVAQKQNIYDQMLRRGVAPHMARAVAESYHDEYREENIRRLNEGIVAYGLNPDGSLNDFGGMLARKLAYEDPTGAQHIVTSYAAPKDLFTHNSAMATANFNAKSALDRELERIKSAQAIAGAKLLQDQKQHEDKMQNESAKIAIDKHRVEIDAAYKEAQLKQSEEERYSKTPEGQYVGWWRYGVIIGNAFGWTDAEIGKFAHNMVTAKNGVGDMDKPYEEISGLFRNQLSRIEKALMAGDVEKAQEIWTTVDKLASDVEFKNISLLTQDDTDFIDSRLRLYQKVMAGKMTVQELEKILNVSSYKGGNDQKLDDFRNSPEFKKDIDKAKEKKKNSAEVVQNIEDINKQISEKGYYINSNPEQRDWFKPRTDANYSSYFNPYSGFRR